MLLSEWVDVAWSKLLDGAPAMSNPFDYQKKMYRYFFLGEQPEEEEKSATEAVEDAREAIGKGIPTTARSEFDEMMARAQAMQAESGGTE